MKSTKSKARNFDKIIEDKAFFLDCYREMLTSIGEEKIIKLLNIEETTDKKNKEQIVSDEKIIQSFGIYFQMINLIEENAAAQYRRGFENNKNIASIRGSWGETFKQWKEQGLDESLMIKTISSTQVSPVLTAHPTEAKRITILELHREMYLLLVKNENSTYSNIEKKNIRKKIISLLERWWRTGETYIEKPDLKSERDNVVHYLSNMFPLIVETSDLRLRYSWLEMGLDPEKLKHPEEYPIYNFGSWVGGDRDGHPFVTPEITRNTLLIHREKALNLVKEQLLNLGKKISLSSILNPVPEKLTQSITKKAGYLGEDGKNAVNRNPYEPWRQYVNLLLCKLNNTISGEYASSNLYYKSAKELQEDLKFLRDVLTEIGAANIAEDLLFPIERFVQCFGFHLAKLDVRQNSSYYDKAITQILQKERPTNSDFQNWDETKRVHFLKKELANHSLLTDITISYGEEADNVLDYFRVVRNHINLYGADGIGSFIVSMTRSFSDLLVIYLLMKETQLLGTKIPVVPLFETIDDLENGQFILDKFFSFPLTIKRLKAIQNSQEVMIGYSDSNKDGGVLASKWNLYKGEKTMSEVGRKHNINIFYFHGRGGTISRGGGKYHRFIESMPTDTVNGKIKLTIQGESISQEFGNLLTGTYNLEMLASGVARHTIKTSHEKENSFPIDTLNWLSEKSLQHYQNFVKDPDFMKFYSQATPIDVLEQSRIGSRPARRTGKRSLNDLRAIPWVFSWNLSRFALTGWYGVGHALKELKEQDASKYEALKNHIATWPFLKYFLIQTETNILITKPKIMKKYAKLVGDPKIKSKFLKRALSDYEEGIKHIEYLLGGPASKRREGQLNNLKLREKKLKSLHELHINYITKWREAKETNPVEAAKMLEKLLLITNSLAGGLKSTG